MSLQQTNPGRRWPGVILAVLVVLFIAGIAAYRFAIRTVEARIMTAVGPQGEVKELRVSPAGIEITGLRIRASQGGEKSAGKCRDLFDRIGSDSRRNLLVGEHLSEYRLSCAG